MTQEGEAARAAAQYEALLLLDPSFTPALNNLAWILLTAPDKSLRDPQRGLELAELGILQLCVKGVAVEKFAP